MTNHENRKRPYVLSIRATQQEKDYIHSVKAKLNLTLLELISKGIEALEKANLTEQINKEAK